MPEDRPPALPDELLDILYKTLVEPEGWNDAVGAATRYLGGANGALQTRQLAPEMTASMITSGVDQAFHRAYIEHYFAHDPHLVQAEKLAEGQAMFSRDLLPDEDFRRSGYYHEFCEPQGIQDLLGVVLLRDDELCVSFASYGPKQQRFEEPHRRRLQALAPHLARVLRLSLEQEHLQIIHDGLDATQRALGAVSFRVDRQLCVLATSGSCKPWLALAAPPFELRRGRLLADAGWRGDLELAVARALAGETCQWVLGAPQHAKCVVAPSRNRSEIWPRRFVNVLLLPSGNDARVDALEALPPSLLRVARLLARGASDKDIASELDMSLPSARTYTARVLKRLGLQNRRELILRFQAKG